MAVVEPELLTAKEAARYLSIGTSKLWELTNRREIASVRIGRAVRYKLDDLRSFVERNRRAPPRP